MVQEDGASHYQAHGRSCRTSRTDRHGAGVEVEKGKELSFLDTMVHIRRHEAFVDRLRRPEHHTRLDAKSKGPAARRYREGSIAAGQGIRQKGGPL